MAKILPLRKKKKIRSSEEVKLEHLADHVTDLASEVTKLRNTMVRLLKLLREKS